ncbi:MAG: hypothetical protein GY725_01225 [bacterium]|nr:hypothetical protein [bacterium]
MARILIMTLGLFGMLSVALPASAAPTTYNFTSGDATITADTTPGGVSVLASASYPLDGIFVEFDDALPALTDFAISVAPTGVIAMANPYGGYDQLEIVSAILTPGVGYTNFFVAGGPTSYSFAVGPVEVNAVYNVTDSTLTNPPQLGVPLTFSNSSISGTIDISLMQLELSGLTLGVLSGAAFGEADDLVIKADITLEGTAVPEPGLGVLLGMAIGTFIAVARRSNRG